MKLLLLTLCIFLLRGAAEAQIFVATLGGTAALSGKSIIQSVPPAAANYDPRVGPAANFAVGYHFNDWLSAQAGYIWNRNRITTTHLDGSSVVASEDTPSQHALAIDAMLYFRPHASRLRPYLSAGPALVRLLEQRKPALRVAVGIDITAYRGWKFRYSFSEMMSGNPLGTRLQPPASGGLMNFQNLFGFTKTF